MKRSFKLLCALALMGSSYLAHAGDGNKNVKITWGPEFELPKKHYELGFVGDNKTGYVEVSHQRGKTISLQKFTPALKLTGQNDVSTSSLPKGYMIESLWDMNNKNYIFYSTYSKSDPVERLFAQELDAEKGQFKGTAKEILNSPDKITGTLVMTGMYQFNTADKWSLIRSADSSMLMVKYRIKPTEKKDAINKDKIGLFVFDKNMNKVWGDIFEMPYTEKMMDNDDYQVDSKGNVYILAKVYKSDEKKRDKNDYRYEVLMYSKDSKKPNISSFSFADKYVTDIALDEDRSGRMLCTGFYSKKKAGGTDGAFFLAFDEASKTMKNIHKGFYEFPTDLIKQYESEKTKKKIDKKEEKGNDTEVSNLEFRNLVIADDGTITMVGEQYKLVITYYTDKYGVHERRTYYYDDIYVTTIGPDGDLKWITKVPKAQVGNSPTTLGFHMHTSGKSNYLFFVDNIKNLDLKKDEAPARHMGGAGGVLMCVKVDENGKTSKSSIFDFREEKMNVIVKDFSDVTDKIIIGRARKLHGPFQMNFTAGKPLQITVD